MSVNVSHEKALTENMTLETHNLILRPWRIDDAEALYKYASDPEVGPRAGWAPHQNVEESLTIIEVLFSREYMWAITLRGSDEPIGCVGYLPSDMSNLSIQADEAEVGYWVARPFWNRGICTEALREIVRYCFEEKHFSALWGDCFLDNPASTKVMEHVGFQDCNMQTYCPNLRVGADRPVRVLKLVRGKGNR